MSARSADQDDSPFVGTMLQDSTAPEALNCYRAEVVAPRRRRIRAVVEQARHLGLIDLDADLDVTLTMSAREPASPDRSARLARRGRQPTPLPGRIRAILTSGHL